MVCSGAGACSALSALSHQPGSMRSAREISSHPWPAAWARATLVATQRGTSSSSEVQESTVACGKRVRSMPAIMWSDAMMGLTPS